MMFLAVISLIYIAIMLGKEDGKWGLLIALGIFAVIGMIADAVK